MGIGDVWPEHAGDHSDAELDTMVSSTGEHLLAAIHASLDLDESLVRIIGAPPCRQDSAGESERAADDGEWLVKLHTAALAPAAGARAGGRRRRTEDRYLAGPGKALHLRVTVLRNQLASVTARADMARRAVEQAESLAGKPGGRYPRDIRSGLMWPLIPAVILAGMAAAYQAATARLPGQVLAIVLAGLIVLIGTGTAFFPADRWQVSGKRRRYAVARGRLAMIQEMSDNAGAKLEQDFLTFLVKTEGLPLGLARLRAAALLESMADSADASPSLAEQDGPVDRAASGLGARPPVRWSRGVFAVTASAVVIGAAVIVQLTVVPASKVDSAVNYHQTRAANSAWQTSARPQTADLGIAPGTDLVFTRLVPFAAGQGQLSNSAKASLGSWLSSNDFVDFDSARITITGYTAAVPGGGASYPLTRTRVHAVAAYVETQGIPPSWLAVSAVDHPSADRQVPDSDVLLSVSVKV